MRAAILCLLFVACGDSEKPYTWGDASDEVAVAWCNAEARCFEYTREDTDKCFSHLTFHLCELTDTCDVALPDEAPEAVAECAAKLAEAGDTDRNACWYISLGVTPYACDGFWALRPEKSP